MENNIINLSSFGFSNYDITESGKVCKLQPLEKEMKCDANYRFYLIDDNGKEKRKTLKQIYKLVFNKEFCMDSIQNLINEQWKEIPNTEGKYFVSNCGRIKSYCGYNAIILKADKTESGYLIVKINNKNVRVHRLVAEAFCENKYKETDTVVEIHHKDKNKQNNKAANLQILSVAEHHKIHNKKEKIDNAI